MRVLSLGGAGKSLGDEGAATVARALESGRCDLTSLTLYGKWGALLLSLAHHCAVLRCIAMPYWAFSRGL